jgi:SAM-dependent MidA family methyltransferase
MLKERLLQQITETGPIPFEDFMEVALYDPDEGFFSGEAVRSTKEGDFLTSPEVSPMFGETLARFVEAERELLGEPAGFAVVEVGSGSGSLLAPMLDALQPPPPAWAVEASPAARAVLGELLGEDRALGSLGELPGRQRGVVITNELIDNLPMALAARSGDGWEERWVGVDDGDLILTPHPARADVVRWCDDYAGSVPNGGMVEVQLAAGRWIDTALSVLDSGALLVFDYGGTAAELEPRRTQGTLRTYRAHHLGPDPLLEPGATDITADVNFTALAAAAEEAGATVALHRQDEFLAEWGLRDRLSELRATELELARGSDVIARLQVRSQVTDAETLLHPRGLGDFRVMVARLGSGD